MSVFEDKAPGIMTALMNEFPGMGITDAAAIVGNLGHESGGFSQLQEINPSIPGSKGGYGWAQWTGPRRVDFERFCAENNLLPHSDPANFKFLVHELQTTEREALFALKAEGTLEAKVKAFEKAYERSGVKHFTRRVLYAERALIAYRE